MRLTNKITRKLLDERHWDLDDRKKKADHDDIQSCVADALYNGILLGMLHPSEYLKAEVLEVFSEQTPIFMEEEFGEVK